ncbi:hypothetical protein [Lentzea sp. NPDC060358]|uniref:hypothetical protein n=1 Tax=Lentzea sp. NPDC060358 TaxID=3347103 RepID=UPI0036572D80
MEYRVNGVRRALHVAVATAGSLLAMATAAGATTDLGPAGNGNASLVGPVVVPVEANNVATNAAQHVNTNVCDTAATVLGISVPVETLGADCTTPAESGVLPIR